MSRIVLVGREPNEPAPDLAVYAVDRELKPIAMARVDEKGGFELPDDAIAKAGIIIVGGYQEKVERLRRDEGVPFRPRQFRELLKAGDGVLELARPRWEKLLIFRRCVTGSVRRCDWRPWWLDLVAQPVSAIARHGLAARAAAPAALASRALQPTRLATRLDLGILPIFPRCAKVCEGLVEVYLRTCCWHPIVIYDPRIPEIIDILERLPEYEIPRFPPLPDPPPFETVPFFKGGALDAAVLNAKVDLAALKALPLAELPAYIESRPYLRHLYHCGTAHKVGQGLIQPDGTFQVCWRDFPRLLLPWCHDEVAYVVKQVINGTTVTIYDGPAAGDWFGVGEQPVLTSWHPQAVGCRDGDVPRVEGAVIYLDAIGSTDAHRLKTPPATGWDRVGRPAGLHYNDGLAHPAPSPAAARGALLDCNWGGELRLRWWFTEPCRLAGARYYRASVRAADSSGAPIGPTHYLGPPGGAWEKLVNTSTGFDVVPTPLGVPPVGGQANLFTIPYDDELPTSEEWRDGQYHAALPTTDHADGRWLLTLEVFNTAGQRLRPLTGTGGGEPADFRYLRWEAPGTPDVFTDIPFEGLTHMLWWDNRAGTGDIEGVAVAGSPTPAGTCLFLTGPGTAELRMRYRAYHPVEAFLQGYALTCYRGLEGPVHAPPAVLGGVLPVADATVNAGEPPAPAALSVGVDFADLLGTHSKCSFAVNLTMSLKTTNGSGFLYQGNLRDTVAFALEIV